MPVLTDSRGLRAYRERNGRICWFLLRAGICFLSDEHLAGEAISRILYAARIPSIPPFAPIVQRRALRMGHPKNHSRRGDHSSGPSITRKLDAAYPRVHPFKAANRFAGENPSNRFAVLRIFDEPGPALPSSLALLHAGFSVPPMSPSERWALTPPFHPYLCGAQTGQREVLPPAGRRGAILTGGLVSVELSVAEPSQVQPPGVTRRVALTVPKRRSPDFPPARSPCDERTSDHPSRPLGSL